MNATHADAAIEERVKGVVSQMFGFSVSDLRNDSSFKSDMGADSLDVIELVMALEEEFDLDVSDDDAREFETIQSVIDYMAAHSKPAR